MYKPNPINTDDIELSEDLLTLAEELAANTHDVWAAERIAQGWTYGTVRDDEKKKTPCLVPYDKLPESEKEYDRNTAMETLKAIISLGYRIEKDDEDKYDDYIYSMLKGTIDDLFGDIVDERDEYDEYDDYDEDDDSFDDIIVLANENGEEASFKFLDVIEYKDEQYAVTMPMEDDVDDGAIVIFRIEEDDDVESYISVDDDNILQAVYEIFKNKFKDEFDFRD